MVVTGSAAENAMHCEVREWCRCDVDLFEGVLVKACCSVGCDYLRQLLARFRCGGGGFVDGEVREWWSAASMVMVGEEEN